ncbi:hypothetical protein, partial [Klebsiella pneumoniae]|uniref:hypothetical protein n=1 Tax=Klebsiella pneumoniae TaxID=573 RepID=UPI0034E97DF8
PKHPPAEKREAALPPHRPAKPARVRPSSTISHKSRLHKKNLFPHRAAGQNALFFCRFHSIFYDFCQGAN